MDEAVETVIGVPCKLKRGDAREDGKVYAGTWRSGKWGGEYWVTPEKLHEIRRRACREKKAAWARKSPEERAKVCRQKNAYVQNNPERKAKQKAARQAWQKRNKDRLNAKHKAKRDNDPVFAISHRIRRTLNFAFTRKGYKKNGFARDIIGCSWEELKSHIESQFQDGMTWENRSLWHVDHKIPIASASSVEDVKRLNHFTNLQPLWKEDNLAKGAKITAPDTVEST